MPYISVNFYKIKDLGNKNHLNVNKKKYKNIQQILKYNLKETFNFPIYQRNTYNAQSYQQSKLYYLAHPQVQTSL